MTLCSSFKGCNFVNYEFICLEIKFSALPVYFTMKKRLMIDEWVFMKGKKKRLSMHFIIINWCPLVSLRSSYSLNNHICNYLFAFLDICYII